MNRQERVQEVYNYLVFTHAVENQRGRWRRYTGICLGASKDWR